MRRRVDLMSDWTDCVRQLQLLNNKSLRGGRAAGWRQPLLLSGDQRHQADTDGNNSLGGFCTYFRFVCFSGLTQGVVMATE